MPSVSQAQHGFMGACKGGVAKKSCPPEKVVSEFLHADKGRKIKKLPRHSSRSQSSRR